MTAFESRHTPLGLWLLSAAALAFFVTGRELFALPIRGEESRWAQVATEMIASGNFITPTVQNIPHADRPPLAVWCIALVGVVTGEVGVLAVRLPSLLATVGVAVLLAWHAGRLASPAAGLVAAAAFVTFGQVLQLGRLGETDALLTFFVAASLIVWHHGRRFAPDAVWPWFASYALCAGAALTKGLQGPVYFEGAIVTYLAFCRDWRTLFSKRHLLSGALAFGIVALWVVPFTLAHDIATLKQIWFHQAAARFSAENGGELSKHLLTFPFEAWVCLMPWSCWLLAFLDIRWWRTRPIRESHALFLIVAAAIAFATLWIAPTARPRYLMPVYPLLAALMGFAWHEGSLGKSGLPKLIARWFARLSLLIAVLASIGGGGLCLVALIAPRAALPSLMGSGVVALISTIAVAPLAKQVFADLPKTWLPNRLLNLRVPNWLRTALEPAWAPMFALAFLVSAWHVGVAQNYERYRSEDQATRIAFLKNRLPEGAALKSLGRGHHLFIYHFGEPVSMLAWPSLRGGARDATPSVVPKEGEYFCFERAEIDAAAIPFEWEQVDFISCERRKTLHPEQAMVIGRRLSQAEVLAKAQFSKRR